MKKRLQTQFSERQYMVSRDFELYYYNDHDLSTVTSHTHDYYEFYFFLEGRVRMQVEDRIYPLRYGDILLILPHRAHRLLMEDPHVPYRRFVFWISKEYFSHLLTLSDDYGYLMKYAAHNDVCLFHNDRVSFHAMQSKILRLLEEMHSRNFGRESQIPLMVKDLILHLNRVVYTQNNPRAGVVDDSLYRRICSYIEEHIEEDLSLDTLAAVFFVNKFHIAHLFKENLGISVHQYIMSKRLSLCCEAILGDAKITSVYQTFGFGDYSSFYRAFKKEYGMSPKEYRTLKYNPF